jgi:hypothetical protein
MERFKSTAAAAAIVAALLVIAFYAFGDNGPGGGLIKSSAVQELNQQNKDCVVTKFAFIRAGSFVPESHHGLPKGTAFYPVRVNASFTALQDDGSRSDPRQASITLYFYKTEAGKWVYEVNSF